MSQLAKCWSESIRAASTALLILAALAKFVHDPKIWRDTGSDMSEARPEKMGRMCPRIYEG